MDEQLTFVKLIAERLESASIPYMLTGSMAMTFYAVPRMTRDIDLVVEMQSGDVDKLVSLFATDCYIESASVRDALSQHTMFNVIHREWALKADFIIRKENEYRVEEFARRRLLALEELSTYVVAIEDLILSKLVWSRTSRSEVQFRDVGELLKSATHVDYEYLNQWAQTLGVDKALKEIRDHV